MLIFVCFTLYIMLFTGQYDSKFRLIPDISNLLYNVCNDISVF